MDAEALDVCNKYAEKLEKEAIKGIMIPKISSTITKLDC
ncbi:MAG: hypothetical protein CMIDDMOC_00227 [Sodalis sp. Fle]|nr:MAG: hypothetical protein CMIDDMOC_00227 [Sodalis sp. Fle]